MSCAGLELGGIEDATTHARRNSAAGPLTLTSDRGFGLRLALFRTRRDLFLSINLESSGITLEQSREPLFESLARGRLIRSRSLPETRSNERIPEGRDGRQMYHRARVCLSQAGTRGGLFQIGEDAAASIAPSAR